MSFKSQVKQVCRISFFHLRNIAKIRSILSRSDAEKLVHAFITSRLDYCNSLLSGSPQNVVKSPQLVQNAAARVLMRIKKRDHISPVLASLHWLPVKFRIDFKILLLTYKALNNQAPSYISDLIVPYVPNRALRSQTAGLLVVPDTCARSKSTTQPGAGELQPLPVPKRPWSHIGVDFVTGLPVADHLDTILTITDRFSKAVHLVAMAGLPTAKKTAELLLDHVVRLHGFPQDVVSDRGPQFISRFWKAFCRLVGASASLSSGYHPQTNGQTERANQQLGRYLRCFASSQPSTWPRYLLWAELSHNLQTSSATGLSPFETCYGYQPPLFDHQVPEVEVPAAQDMVRRCHLAWIRARAAITRANTEYSRQHCRRHRPGPVFQPGDRVWLSTANLRFPAGSRKLSPRFLGPFPVRDVLGPVAYRLRLPSTLKVHPVFHVSQLKPVVSSPLHPPPARVPTPRDVDGDPVYTVRKILDARRRGRGWQYLVDWQGYGPEERSWEPARSFLDPSLLADFWSRRPGPSGAVPRGGGPVMNSSS
uniref:Integrase catalytic domain-containing protein n=1 Tax=Nothobranchius furzeri TaxID=105023 RepID=A0A8C6MIC4_NOTFU